MNTLFSVIALAILAVTFVSAFGMWWGIAATLAVVLVFAVLRRRHPAPEAVSQGDGASGFPSDLIQLPVIILVSVVASLWLGWWSLVPVALLGVALGLSTRWLRARSAH